MTLDQICHSIKRTTNNIRFAETFANWVRTGEQHIYIQIARHNGHWATQILDFKTMDIIALVEHEDPFDGLDAVQTRLAYGNHSASWKHIIDRAYKHAVLQIINDTRVAQFIALPDGCRRCGSGFGYCLTWKQKVTRCWDCHTADRIHSKWEKGLRDKHPDTSKKTRQKLYEDAGGYCCLCGKEREFDRDATADHAIPIHVANRMSVWSRPWIHSINNMQLACRSCNSRKGKRIA